ncbi:TetR/AcrR family transcriptional regulator [Nocardioides panacisoli]|uniref:TetR/AcrR family transcriptional regulator n=1 Tax=Nocardioides panacisoli TaxID=627624 RepID=UPI001C62A05F|nr:TetR/AcrR family transcriptional regulator [Nocardioides panacisoli]QYJ05234.1 TetR/AcrR family transcriptional regulator [Nocardioides panacisoli]
MAASRNKRVDGRQLRWQQHNEERRQVILDAAVAVLGRHAPGEDIHVQEIADEAGLSRTVVYRHFEDRGDLDLAVQRDICRRATEVLIPALELRGTPFDIIRRILDAYVGWALHNPALTRFAERDLPGNHEKPMDEEILRIAGHIDELMVSVVSLLGTELSPHERSALVPWMFGVVGGCFQSVRYWSGRGELRPPPAEFVDMMTETIWYQIDGLARARDIVLPDGPVEQLLAGLEPEDD